MKRIFLESLKAGEIKISGKDAHHLAYSLRAKKGDRIAAVDKSGYSAIIELTDFDKETITAKCVGEITHVSSGETIRIIKTVGNTEEFETHQKSEEKIFKRHITLADCLPKQNKFDDIVEKATELGVDKIVPLISDRTIARPGVKREASKLDRWARVAKSAAEQCARDTLPEIEEITDLKDWLKNIAPNIIRFTGRLRNRKFDGADTLLLFCNEHENNKTSMHEILKEFKKHDCDKNIIILIGPEGSFSDKEVQNILDCGGISVSLGERILKTDTAAISALSTVQYELSR